MVHEPAHGCLHSSSAGESMVQVSESRQDRDEVGPDDEMLQWKKEGKKMLMDVHEHSFQCLL